MCRRRWLPSPAAQLLAGPEAQAAEEAASLRAAGARRVPAGAVRNLLVSAENVAGAAATDVARRGLSVAGSLGVLLLEGKNMALRCSVGVPSTSPAGVEAAGGRRGGGDLGRNARGGCGCGRDTEGVASSATARVGV